MGAHVFLVGEDNFDICVSRGVYGCVMPSTEHNTAEVVAGVYSIQQNDLVFFYVKNKGIYGVWKVNGEPYFDETKLWPNEGQRYPYRFSFEPSVGEFPVPVSLSDILSLRDKGRVWTFDLGPVQQKNQYKITMDEARELLRLLLRNNPIRGKIHPISAPYVPAVRGTIDLDLGSSQGGKVKYEAWLNAWFSRCFTRGELTAIFGDYKEFLILVPTTFNKVMDMFLTHVANVDGVEVVFKYSCIELKADRAGDEDLAQILRYEDWLARKLAGGDKDMIQSVLIARRFADSVVQYVTNRRRIEEKTVRLITYGVSHDRSTIDLREITAVP